MKPQTKQLIQQLRWGLLFAATRQLLAQELRKLRLSGQRGAAALYQVFYVH